MGCLRGCEGGYEVMSYTYAELTQIANIGTARIIEDSRGIYLLNVMQNIIWKRFDWRFTQANLAPFWLIPYEQDYGRPIVVVPDNMEKIMRAQIVGWNTTGVPVINKIDPRRELDPTNLIGLPQQISFNSSSRALRMWPRPGGSHCAPDFMVTATMKTFPPVITRDNYQTLAVPSSDGGNYDSQIQMWVDVLRYVYFATTGDYEKMQMQYQLANSTMMDEAKNEGIDQGDPQIAPSESLLGRAGGDYGLWFP